MKTMPTAVHAATPPPSKSALISVDFGQTLMLFNGQLKSQTKVDWSRVQNWPESHTPLSLSDQLKPM